MSLKKIIASILCFGLCLSGSMSTKCDAKAFDNSNMKITGVINLKDAKQSKIMSFNEMAAAIAKEENVSITDAKQSLSSSSSVGTYGNDEYTKYVTYSVPLYVTSKYIPELQFYCAIRAYRGESAGITEIVHSHIHREYDNMFTGNLVKGFDGEVFIKLQDSFSIQYLVNGNFTNTYTSTVSSSLNVELGLGESCKISYNAGVFVTSDYYQYYDSGYKVFSAR